MRVREGAAQRKLDNRQSPPHSQPRASTHAHRGDRLEAQRGVQRSGDKRRQGETRCGTRADANRTATTDRGSRRGGGIQKALAKTAATTLRVPSNPRRTENRKRESVCVRRRAPRLKHVHP